MSYDLWRDCQEQLKLQLSGQQQQTLIAGKTGGSVVYYTVRGHGASYGWEQTSNGNDNLRLLAEPFTWPALARDMAAVVNETLSSTTRGHGTSPPLSIFGQSMGAATALYYTMQQQQQQQRLLDNKPQDRNRVSALILARPPRIWKARQAVAQDYVQAFKEYQRINPQSHHYLPILGASMTDLPGPDDKRWKLLTGNHNDDDDDKAIPILLLCHGEDDTHPLESGRLLKERVLPHATLNDKAADEEEARRIWPTIMAEWLVEQKPGD